MIEEMIAPYARKLTEALQALDFALEVRPSPSRVSILPINERRNPRFVLEFSPGSALEVCDTDPKGRMVLVTLAEPAAVGRLVLLGEDEAQLFAQRTPRWRGPVHTVSQALRALTPPAVLSAQLVGAKVIRQGDIWFVPATNQFAQALLRTRHEAQKLVTPRHDAPLAWGWVTHPQHAPVYLPTPHWVYRNEIGD